MAEISTHKTKQFLTYQGLVNWLMDAGNTCEYFGLIVIGCITEPVISMSK
jgi:hypothetical protein